MQFIGRSIVKTSSNALISGFKNLRQDPAISIVLNCYNGEAYLREALDSVIAQVWQDYELIFVDNHSTDRSRQIFDSYVDGRFRYVVPEKFMSLGAARNVGVKHCVGKYIAFLDADDIWLPDKLSKQLAELSNTGVDALYSQAIMFYPDGRECLYSRRKISANISLIDLAKKFDLCLSTLILRREFLPVLDRVFDSDLTVAEDADLLLRIAHSGSVRYSAVIAARYRVHGGSDSWKKPEAFMSDLERMSADYRMRGLDANILLPLLDTAYWVLTIARWSEGDFSGARKALRSISQSSVRTCLMWVMLMFPYYLVAPILRSLGKRVI